MDKSCQSSGESTITVTSSSDNTNTNTNTNSSTGNSNHYLKQLNKLSHKISKPPVTSIPTITRKPPPLDPQGVPPPSQPQQSQPPQQHQHQPPVYNINKNDFRDVVQKLTGSPAHSSATPTTTAPTPPVLHPSKPPSSRLQRIRPPPLAHVTNRPPNLLNCAAPNAPLLNPALVNPDPRGSFVHRPPSAAPLSPLPPLPAVHAAAESPVSAYMRCLYNSASSAFSEPNNQFSGFSPLAPLVSPRWNNLAAATPQQPPPPQAAVNQRQQPLAPPHPPTQGILGFPQLPTSPLPFGCMNSPRSTASSSYPLFSPVLLPSPSSFPLSPTVPFPGPKWRGL